MKALALTNKGSETITAREITSLIKTKTEIEEEKVFFEFDKFEDLFLVSYMGRSMNRILYVLGKVDDELNFGEWIKETFALKSKDKDLEKELSKKIPGKIDFKNPDTLFSAIDGLLCIDFSGDISKRDYRIFLGKEALKGTTAFAALQTADFKGTIIDPMCRAGTIAIEAALAAVKISVHFYSKDKFPFRKLKKFIDYDFDKYFSKLDKVKEPKESITASDNNFRAVQSAQKNAKIAGVHKSINFSRQDIQWLDTKFKKKTVDCIVTMPLELTKNSDSKKIEKHYNELFHQAEFILKPKGNLTAVLRKGKEKLTEAAEKNGMKLSEELTIMQGKEQWQVLKFVL